MSIQIRLLTLILALVAIVAGTVRAEDERREGVAEGRIDGLLLLLKDKDVDVRRGAVSALGETGSIRAVPPLVAALDDDESSVRCAAVEALGKVGQPEVIAPLAALLRDDNDLASAAVAALGKVNSPQALAPLAWALHHGDNVMVMEAAGGLVKFGAAAVDTLVEALQGRAEVRDRAAEALTKIDDAKAAAAVATALGSPDWRIRLSMLGSIAGMETPPDGPWGDLLNPERERKEIRKAALKVLLRWDAPQSVKWLLLAAEDPEPQLRRQAVRALVSRGDKALIRPAMANALGNADVEVRQMAAEFFRSHLISADIPAVSTALINESDTDVLNWLIMALRDIKDKEAGDALAGFLERPGPQGLKESERRQFERALAAATDILAGNDDVRAVKGALRLLDASESHVIEKAIFSLVRLEGEEVFTLLIKAAEHKQLEVRQAAFQVMAERKPKDQRLVKLLLAGASDADTEIRRLSLKGLIGHRSPAALPLFKAALGSDDEESRQAGLKGLASSGLPEAVPLLAEILKDPKTIDMTFHNVLRDLADSRNSGALELWIDMLLNNSDNQRRTQAARALGQLGDRKAIEPLERALVADAYIDVLREAAYALVRIDETVGYQPMMNRLATSQDGRALAAAIKATGEKGFLTALRMVVDQKDQNGAVLRLGMNYLRIFQDRQSIEIIAKHLNNSDPEVARAAFQELRWLRVPEEEIQKMSKEQAIDR